MTKQNDGTPESLLEGIKNTSDQNLEEGVLRHEGVNGSTVKPIYTQRRMRFYSINESELHQINLANLGVAGFSSLGSALFAFWLDIFKDTHLADEIPQATATTLSYTQPILLVASIAFFVIAGAAWWWRKGMIKIIKDEAVQDGE